MRKKKTKSKSCNVLNVGQVMRQNTDLRVSPVAVCEMISFLESHLGPAMLTLGFIAKSHKRKTIFSEDVVELFSRKDNMVIWYE